MIEWTCTAEDVAKIRFAFSPLSELVLSLVVLQAPARHSLHLPWIRATRTAISELDLTEILALVPPAGVTADFLSPAPSSPLPDLSAELATVRATPAAELVRDVGDVRDVPAAVLRRIRADPRGAAHRIADTLQAYWDRALAGRWPRLRSLLEADVLWRAQRLTAGGAHLLFDDLHDSVALRADRLTVTIAYRYAGSLSGAGLVLSPSAMCWPTVRCMVEPYQPALIYPVRGIGTLWETRPAPPPGTLAALIGRSRARLLLDLAEPASTHQLARRHQISPGTVNQHLSVLHAAGLLGRTRIGRTVLYHRTERGDGLVGPPEPP